MKNYRATYLTWSLWEHELEANSLEEAEELALAYRREVGFDLVKENEYEEGSFNVEEK